MTPELQRALRPKITPQAALRMHMQYISGIIVTTATLGMLWSTAFFETWASVINPDAGNEN